MRKLILVILFAVCASSICAQTPTDLPSDHWANEAVKTLIDKGYMVGYPDGSFMGNRSMTRYEIATIVKRLLDDITAQIEMAKVAQSATGQTPSKPITAPAPITGQDIATLQKLVEEFKPELAVIGARVDKLEQCIAGMQGTVENLNAIVTDPEGAFETMKSDVSKLKKVTVSGYVQARYNVFEADPNKPGVNNDPVSNFSIRRARIKVAGKPTEKSNVVIQLDAGQGYVASNAPSTTTPASGPAVTLKDAYIEYAFSGDPSLGISSIIGQTKWPFGYEVVQSSGVRESPERSLIVQRLFPGERDRGACVSVPFLNNKAVWKIGAFNGMQTSQTPYLDAKAGVSTVRFNLGDVDLGVSAWYGKGVMAKDGKLYFGNRDPKYRYGIDAQWYLNNISLKAEYITGKGVDGDDASKKINKASLYNTVNGGWAQVAWNFNKQDALAVKYETMSEDPLYPQFGRRSSWNIGLLRWLDEKSRVKLYYIINQEELKSYPNNAYIAEWINTF